MRKTWRLAAMGGLVAGTWGAGQLATASPAKATNGVVCAEVHTYVLGNTSEVLPYRCVIPVPAPPQVCVPVDARPVAGTGGGFTICLDTPG